MTAQRWLWLGLWSLLLPVSLYFLLAVFVGLDMLDLSSTTGNMVLVVAAGVMAGLFVGFGFRLRDWRILTPPPAAGLIGCGLHPLLETAGQPRTRPLHTSRYGLPKAQRFLSQRGRA